MKGCKLIKMEYHRNEELNCGKKRKKNISVIPGESDSLARVCNSIFFSDLIETCQIMKH